MKQWIRRAGCALLVGVLLVGCATRPTEEKADHLFQEAVADAAAAAESVTTAAEAGNQAAVREAYERFATAFGHVLGPISFTDSELATRMANANTAIKAMMQKGQLDVGRVEREMAVIRAALADSVTATAQAAPPEERITVVAREYRFEPSTIRVKQGTRVLIRLENRGTEPHEFEIEALDFEVGPIAPGKSAEGSFIAEKAGRYRFECHVDGHLKKGMKGTLIVEK